MRKGKRIFLSRRTKIGANIFLQSLIVLSLWGMVNWLNYRHYHRFDLTFNHQFTLSDKTKKILKDLKKPLTITVLYRPGTRLFRQVKDLVKEYAASSGKIKVAYIDPERDRARVELLAKRLKMNTLVLNTVIFESGGKSKHVPESAVLKYNRRSSLYEQPSKPEFIGEEAFTSAILSVTQAKQTTLYFVTGEGEKNTASYRKNGLSNLDAILRRENMEVKKLLLLKEKKIPRDCDVLIITGPTKRFSDYEKKVLDAYLEQGGKLFVAIDPLTETGLGNLLDKWGAKVGNNIVIDPQNRIPFVSPTTFFINRYPYQAITKNMKSLVTLFSLVRSVSPVTDNKKHLRAVSLAKTSDKSWGETNLQSRKARFDKGKDQRGPISIAVAVSGKKKSGTRLVVFGDSDFISNAEISYPGNADLFLNSINWLAEKEKLISIGPKSPDIRKVSISSKTMAIIFWTTVAGLPFLGLLAGGLVWWRRRR